MQTGDVVFFNKSSDIISRGISLFTKSQYTHVGIVYEADFYTTTIAEALADGFQINTYQNSDIHNKLMKSKLVVKRPRLDINKKLIKESIESKLGRPYGFKDIFRIAIYKIFGFKFGGDDPDKLICSEAVARVLYRTNSKINLSKEFNKPFDYISPGNIFHSKQLEFVNPL